MEIEKMATYSHTVNTDGFKVIPGWEQYHESMLLAHGKDWADAAQLAAQLGCDAIKKSWVETYPNGLSNFRETIYPLKKPDVMAKFVGAVPEGDYVKM